MYSFVVLIVLTVFPCKDNVFSVLHEFWECNFSDLTLKKVIAAVFSVAAVSACSEKDKARGI